jgi:RNA polymerase sigma factor (sigma-70 family)
MAQRTLAAVLECLRTGCAALGLEKRADGELLGRFLADRDEAAFAVLVHRHGPLVLAVCRRVLGDVHLAEDAFQATFLVLVRRAASIRPLAPLGPWLYVVARRVALKARARAAAHQRRQREIADMPRTEPLDERTWQELRPVLDEELGRLPEKYRAPLVLCYFEGKSYDEAARELRWPKSSLASRLKQGGQLLRQRLVRRGIALSAGALTTALAEKSRGAAVAALLTVNTAKAAAGVAAGRAVAENVLSAEALALAEEAMRTTAGGRGKLLALLLALALAAGAAFAGYAAWIRPTPPEQPSDPPRKKVAGPLVDLHGDPLPIGAVARMGQDRWLHGLIPRFAEFLPDGKTVVTVNAEEEAVRVWEFPSGKPIRRIPLPPLPVSLGGNTTRAALTSDGKTVAVCHLNDTQIYLHAIATGERLAVLKVAKVGKLAFSPDGKNLAVANGPVRIWDWAKNEMVREFAPGTAYFCWSPNGEWIATRKTPPRPQFGKRVQPGKDIGDIKLWEVATGKEIHNFSLGKGGGSPVFSPDGTTLAVFTDDAIVLVDPATGEKTGELVVPEQFDRNTSMSAPHMVFARNGKRLYVSTYGGHVYEWNVGTGELLREYTNDVGGMGGAPALSPDGDTLILTGWGPVLLNLRGKDIKPLRQYTAPLVSVQFTPDGKQLLTRSRTEFIPGMPLVRRFDAATGKELDRVSLPKSSLLKSVLNSALSPDGKIFVCYCREKRNHFDNGPSRVVLIDMAGGEKLATVLENPSSRVGRMCLSPDSKMLAITLEGKQRMIELREIPSGELLRTFTPVTERGGHPNLFGGALLFSPDGKMLAAYAGNDTLGLWETTTGVRVHQLSLPVLAPPPEPWSIWFLRHSEMLMASAAFSPDGRCMALERSDGTAGVYELASGQPRQTLGKKLTAPRRKPRQDVPFPDEPGCCFAFNRDGQWLARGGFDCVVRVWDLRTGDELAAFPGHSEAVTGVAFAPDGRRLASASADGTALIWDVSKLKR